MQTLGMHALMPADYLIDCDVVIVNYNAGSLLRACVESVRLANVRRIVVVDNDSRDGSLEALEGHFHGGSSLIVVRNTSNLGFAAACNIGMRSTSASRILFLNPDSFLADNALQLMIDVLDAQGNIGMVGGFLSNLDGTEQPGGRRVFPTPRRAFMRAFGLSPIAKYFPEMFSDYLLHREELPLEPVQVEAISGACVLVKRRAIEDVGLWDEKYFLHCEDLDWCMRFRLSNWKVMFVPDAKIMHVWGACSRSLPFFVEWHKHRGMIRFYSKYFRANYSGLLWVLVNVGVWLRFSLVVTYYSAHQVLRKLGLVRD